MNLEFSRQIFEKEFKYQISRITVEGEPRRSRRTDGQTDMMKLIATFYNSPSAKKLNEKSLRN